MIKIPYGQTFALKTALENVECWNMTGNERFTLPAGTLLKLEHCYDSFHTTCMAQNPAAQTKVFPAIPEALELFPGAYRFIVENQALGAAIGVPMPKKTADLVGDIIAYESGEADEKQTKRLFKTLKKTGIGSKLQGHYSSRM